MEYEKEKRVIAQGLMAITIGDAASEWERQLDLAMEDLAGDYGKVEDYYRIFDWSGKINAAVEGASQLSDAEWVNILGTHRELIHETLLSLGIYARIHAVYDNKKYADEILADFKKHINNRS